MKANNLPHKNMRIVNEMQQLKKQTDSRTFHDSWAYIESQRIEERMRSLGYVKCHAHTCIQKLVSKHCLSRDHRPLCECSPPWSEHGALWLQDDKPLFYLCHPYELHRKASRSMDEFADQYGLDWEVRAESNYRPGRSIAVCWFREGKTNPMVHL